MNRLKQLTEIRNKIYQVVEKLSTEIDLQLEATRVNPQSIYALAKIADSYSKMVMSEEKLEQEIAKREAIAAQKQAKEDTPPEEISAADKVILGMMAEKLYGPDVIKPSEANYNWPREGVPETFELSDAVLEKFGVKVKPTSSSTPPPHLWIEKIIRSFFPIQISSSETILYFYRVYPHFLLYKLNLYEAIARDDFFELALEISVSKTLNSSRK